MKENNVYAYLRVSTNDQDLDNQRLGILNYLKDKKIESFTFCEEKVSGARKVEDRELSKLEHRMKEGDLLVVSELSRLGRNTVDVLGLLSRLMDKGVNIHSVKEGHDINQGIESKVLSLVMCMSAEIARDLTSRRIKESIALRRSQGKPIGRPKGSTGSSKLEPYKEEIEQYRKNKVSKSAIARIYEVTWPTVNSFCRNNGL